MKNKIWPAPAYPSSPPHSTGRARLFGRSGIAKGPQKLPRVRWFSSVTPRRAVFFTPYSKRSARNGARAYRGVGLPRPSLPWYVKRSVAKTITLASVVRHPKGGGRWTAPVGRGGLITVGADRGENASVRARESFYRFG